MAGGSVKAAVAGERSAARQGSRGRVPGELRGAFGVRLPQPHTSLAPRRPRISTFNTTPGELVGDAITGSP